MNTKNLMTTMMSLAVVLPLGVEGQERGGGSASAEVPMNPEVVVQEKMQALEAEFRELSARLQEIEKEALEHDAVAEARASFESMVEEKVIEAEPELEAVLEEREKYSKIMEDLQAGKELPEGVEVNEVYAGYNAAHQQVMPVQQQVMQQEDAREAFSEFQQLLIAQMRKVDQKVSEYLARQEALRNEYQSLVQTLQGGSD